MKTHQLLFAATLIAGLRCQESGVRAPIGPVEPARLGERPLKALRGMGLVDARPGPYQLFVCDKRDSSLASTGFVAKNAQGETVTGMVCCGLMLKGCTVRF